MGCGGSKNKKEQEIDFEMAVTKVPELDDFFDTCAAPLSRLKDLTDGLNDSRDEFFNATWVDTLLVTPTLSDAVRVMIFCMGAQCKGEWAEIGFAITGEEPYLGANPANLNMTNKDIYDKYVALFTAIKNTPGELQGLVGELTALVEEGQSKAEGAVDGAKNAGLGPMDAVKAGANAAKNVKKLAGAPALCNATITACTNLAQDLQSLGKLLSDATFLPQVKEIGKKAGDAHKEEPNQLIAGFWPFKENMVAKPPVAKKVYVKKGKGAAVGGAAPVQTTGTVQAAPAQPVAAQPVATPVASTAPPQEVQQQVPVAETAAPVQAEPVAVQSSEAAVVQEVEAAAAQ